jgi:hypothetical protein
VKKVIYFSIAIALFVSCSEISNMPDDLSEAAAFSSIVVGNADGVFSTVDSIYSDLCIDTVHVKDQTADFTNVYLRCELEEGCKVEPLEGSPAFGVYADFSVPCKYKITAPAGNSAEWTVVLATYVETIACLADLWEGSLSCSDDVYPSYNPTSCTGAKINDNCNQLKISFDFWADTDCVVDCELELGALDSETMTGTITLLNDVSFTSWGYDMSFTAGSAGTYNASSGTLSLSFIFSGYSDYTSYEFTFIAE